MTIIFYPYSDDLEASPLPDKLTQLMGAAERYKAAVLETTAPVASPTGERKRIAPRDIANSYNWEEIAKVLQEIRNLPEASPESKIIKASHLEKLAGIYEVLRGAKMAKLEAVRLALMNEANQLNPGKSQVV